MLTPLYEPDKQWLYRDVIKNILKSKYGDKRDIFGISLAGAHAFKNKDSIESFLVNNFKGLTLRIPEQDKASYLVLVRSMKKVKKQRSFYVTNYKNIDGQSIHIDYAVGEINKNKVIVFNCSLNQFHLLMKERVLQTHNRCHFAILDHFSFNDEAYNSLLLMRDLKLLKNKCTIFQTSCEPKRQLTHLPLTQKIIKRASNGNYMSGINNLLKSMFNNDRYKTKEVVTRTYKNHSKAIRMFYTQLEIEKRAP